MATNICIKCRKSGGLCSWSSNLKPVLGWDAEAIKRNTVSSGMIDGYYVKACPEFEPDDIPKNKHWTDEEVEKLKEFMKQKVSRVLIAEALNKPVKSIYYKISEIRKGDKKCQAKK